MTDLNRLLGEKVMGWEYTTDLLDHCNGYARIVKENAVSDWFKWTPTTDIGQAFMVEERIKEMGVKTIAKYVTALIDIVRTGVGYPEDNFRLIHATPEQRCRAVSRAIGG